MAQITRIGTPSLCSLLPNGADVLAGRIAGEDLSAFDAVHIKADGLVWKSTGAAANASAKVRGYAAKAVKAGQAITVYKNVRVEYGSAMTPGTDVYLSATAGTLSDVPTTGGTAPIGFVVDATRVQLFESRY